MRKRLRFNGKHSQFCHKEAICRDAKSVRDMAFLVEWCLLRPDCIWLLAFVEFFWGAFAKAMLLCGAMAALGLRKAPNASKLQTSASLRTVLIDLRSRNILR